MLRIHVWRSLFISDTTFPKAAISFLFTGNSTFQYRSPSYVKAATASMSIIQNLTHGLFRRLPWRNSFGTNSASHVVVFFIAQYQPLWTIFFNAQWQCWIGQFVTKDHLLWPLSQINITAGHNAILPNSECESREKKQISRNMSQIDSTTGQAINLPSN